MAELLVVSLSALLVIAGATVAGPRLGVAAPLLLVLIGVGASFLPVFSGLEIEPDLILEGVLPPLLYSAAVSMPTMNFRREFGAISGLSVLLVVVSSLVLGLFFMLVFPGIGFAWGCALGAVVSPTDAVATSIIKRQPVSPRVVALLDGEGLLNDATALVLLRTAIVGTAAAVTFWDVAGTFAYAVVVAVAIGVAAGFGNLFVRRRVTDSTVNTVISFTVPFVASLPAEALGASGLVAAVAAGLVTGFRAPRDLSPQHRLSDTQNWRTVEVVLEGAVFLMMGLEVRAIVGEVEREHAGVGPAVLVAAGALVLVVLVRAAYVVPLLAALAAQGRRHDRLQPRLENLQEKLSTPEGRRRTVDAVSTPRRQVSERDLDRFATRLTRGLANIEYFRRESLGWRDGVVVVWAGMRGAVTVAAVQTLPPDAPQRSTLVLVAYAVAVMSLLLQGGTVAAVVRRVTPPEDPAAAAERNQDELARLFETLRAAAGTVPEPEEVTHAEPGPAGFPAMKRHRLAVIAAQRSALLDARDDGTFDADILQDALATLDATQIDLELRGRLAGTDVPD
ncbi:cation:proton antiporter [Myceligenerans crystallogenes]|uniref:Sodium:proton antiporter n=1 Tax=Myceligenerans crystallogenes TaxID=316335 RepID=A0ABN2NHT8_9MICO